MKLTKNINLNELDCKCGCKTNFKYPAMLAYELQQIVDHFPNTYILIISGCRCVNHNRKVNGATRSKHLPDQDGHAADFVIINRTTKQQVPGSDVQKVVDQLWPGKKGFKNYNNAWQHFDTRSSYWRG